MLQAADCIHASIPVCLARTCAVTILLSAAMIISVIIIMAIPISFKRTRAISSIRKQLERGGKDQNCESLIRSGLNGLDPRLTVELVLLSIATAMNLAFIPIMAPTTCHRSGMSLVFDGYLLLLASARSFGRLGQIRAHSTWLYYVRITCVAWQSILSFEKSVQPIPLAINTVCIAIFPILCSLHATLPSMPIFIGTVRLPGLYSRLCFQWMTGLVWRSWRSGDIDIELYKLLAQWSSSAILRKFRGASQLPGGLVQRLYRFVKLDLLKQGWWATLASVAVFVPPMLMRTLLIHLESRIAASSYVAWLCVVGFLVSGVIVSVAECQCSWKGRQISAQLRSLLLNEAYSRTLDITVADRRKAAVVDPETPSGEDSKSAQPERANIVNLISSDIENVSDASGNLYMIWVNFPVQMVIGTTLLYNVIGVSGLLGIATMILFLPLNWLLSKKLMSEQVQVQAAGDKRIHAANELLQSIRTIKYYAWETVFKQRILRKRETELQFLRSRFIWWSICMTFFYSLPFLVTIVTCFFYSVVWRNELGTSVIFPTLTILGIMRIPLNRIADSITYVTQAHVSLRRVDDYLQSPQVACCPEGTINDLALLELERASFRWPQDSLPDDVPQKLQTAIPMLPQNPVILHDLSIQFRHGDLNVIFGPSGSGKTSLIFALLGELECVQGRVNSHKSGQPGRETSRPSPSFSFCAQEPWLINQTVRSNILLGENFDVSRYETVLAVTDLRSDLSMMSKGDQTLAGERGSKLSGGQRQRIALARALYKRCQYVILDDCLSALDHHTANHVLEQALVGPMMTGRTCILSSNNSRLAAVAKHVVVLKSGRVLGQGTYEELSKCGVLETSNSEIGASEERSQTQLSAGRRMQSPETDHHSTRQGIETDPKHSDSESSPPLNQECDAERLFQGVVGWSVLTDFFGTFGRWYYWLAVLFAFMAQQLVALGANLWMEKWAFQYDSFGLAQGTAGHDNDEHILRTEQPSAGYYLGIYSAICICYAACTFSRDMAILHGSIRASATKYKQLLDSVCGASLLFFDSVSVGQITNRLSRDIEVLDQHVTSFSTSAFQLFVSLAVILCLVGSTLVAFVPAAIVIFIAYYLVVVVYLSGARGLKSLESVARSPLYQHFEEGFQGRVSIRAYGQKISFSRQAAELVDEMTRPYLLLWAGKEWLTFRVGVLGSIVTCLIGAFILGSKGAISAGIAGLTLTYATRFTETLLWLAQVYAIVQQNLTSVERIQEYAEIQPEERSYFRDFVSREVTLTHEWPSRGRICFNNYSAGYDARSRSILQDICLDIEPGQQVAIVGRTGAGKSTVGLALIRALQTRGGTITIDGIDIASVRLQRLRQAITIISQTPEIFEGTLRENLDPLGNCSDDEMLQTLCTVRLLGPSDHATVSYRDLDRTASSLSRGQQQLLCIARGLLRRTSIILLDEATASVDYETDRAIRQYLRSSAVAGVTVLTIAHRLLTVAEHDQVVVLDSGRLVERGSVQELLSRSSEVSPFRRLCEDSGELADIENATRHAPNLD